MAETKKLKVTVTEREHEGRKFNVYNTYSKNGRKIELKFRREVKDLPTTNCYIVVNVDDMHLNTANEYPVLWVKAIQSTEDIATANAENNRKKIDEFFD